MSGEWRSKAPSNPCLTLRIACDVCALNIMLNNEAQISYLGITFLKNALSCPNVSSQNKRTRKFYPLECVQVRAFFLIKLFQNPFEQMMQLCLDSLRLTHKELFTKESKNCAYACIDAPFDHKLTQNFKHASRNSKHPVQKTGHPNHQKAIIIQFTVCARKGSRPT